MENYNKLLASQIISIKDNIILIIEPLTISTDREQEFIESKQNQLNEIIRKLKSHDLYSFLEERCMEMTFYEAINYDTQLLYFINYLKCELGIMNSNFNIRVE